MTEDELKIILEKHRKWLAGDPGGERADFSGQNLDGVILQNTVLARLKAKHAMMRNADLSHSYCAASNFYKTNLDNANLKNTNFFESNFTGASLVHTNFTNATLFCTVFRETDLRYACFKGADLTCVDFTGAQLEHTIFRNCTLCHSEFNSADLTCADFTDADLENCRMEETILDDAVYDREEWAVDNHKFQRREREKDERNNLER